MTAKAAPRVMVQADPSTAARPGILLGAVRRSTPLFYVIDFGGGDIQKIPAKHCREVAP